MIMFFFWMPLFANMSSRNVSTFFALYALALNNIMRLMLQYHNCKLSKGLTIEFLLKMYCFKEKCSVLLMHHTTNNWILLFSLRLRFISFVGDKRNISYVI